MNCVCVELPWAYLVYMHVLKIATNVFGSRIIKEQIHRHINCSRGSSSSPVRCSFYHHFTTSSAIFSKNDGQQGQSSTMFFTHLVGKRQKVRGRFVRTMLEASKRESRLDGWLQRFNKRTRVFGGRTGRFSHRFPSSLSFEFTHPPVAIASGHENDDTKDKMQNKKWQMPNAKSKMPNGYANGMVEISSILKVVHLNS